MDQQFDVLRRGEDGLVWRAAASSLDEAKTTVERLRKSEGGVEFVITIKQWSSPQSTAHRP